MTNKAIYFLWSIKDSYVSFIATSLSICYGSIREWNLTPVRVFSMRERAGIASTLSKLKLEAATMQLVALLEKKFFYDFFFGGGGNFRSNCFFELPWVACSKTKTVKFLIKHEDKESKDQRKIYMRSIKWLLWKNRKDSLIMSLSVSYCSNVLGDYPLSLTPLWWMFLSYRN